MWRRIWGGILYGVIFVIFLFIVEGGVSVVLPFLLGVLSFYELVSLWRGEWGVFVPVGVVLLLPLMPALEGFNFSEVINALLICLALFPLWVVVYAWVKWRESGIPSIKSFFMPVVGTVAILFFFVVYPLTYYSHLMVESRKVAIWLTLTIWISDTMQYYVGIFAGKRKIVPHISPGKSVEGTTGGIIIASVSSTLISVLLGLDGEHWILWFLMGLAVCISGFLGDLFFSLVKRAVGIKDYGSILPGHGGILDRIDSLCISLLTFNVIKALSGVNV